MRRTVRVIVAAMLIMSLCACGSSKTTVGYDAEYKFDDLKVIDISLTEEDYGIGVDKDHPELLEAVNRFIKESNENGTFSEICSHYNGGTPVAVSSVPRDNTKDQLVVATTADFEPFDYVEDDRNYGIDKEIVAALADYLGKELVLEYVNFDIMFMTVAQHKADLCIAGITINEAREKYVDFSDPYYHEGLIIVTTGKCKLFDEARTAGDVEKILADPNNNLRVAVENMTIGQYYCEGDSEFGYKGFPVSTTSYASLANCLEALEEDEADIIIGDAAPLKYLIEN